MKKTQGIAAIAAIIFTTTTQAEQPLGWYVTPQLGVAHVTIDDSDVGGTWNVIAYNFAVGYQATQHIGVELGYMGTGKLRERIVSGSNTGDLEEKISGLNASVIGSAILSDRWSFFGRAGAVNYKEKAKGFVNGNLVVSASDTSTKAYLGAGFAANVEGGQATFELDRALGIDGGSFTTLFIGVRWFVGGRDRGF